MAHHRKISRKHAPIMMAALLTGVTFAGAVSAVIGTPQGENDFLHEHLDKVPFEQSLNWETVEFDLADEDKAKISKIITQTERSILIEGSIEYVKQILTGQALEAAQSNQCLPNTKPCTLTVRVNRQLSAAHLNKDMRVVNVLETSRRADLVLNTDNAGIELKELSDETRVMGFYQTQSGWMQNMSIRVKTKPLIFEAREGQFQDRFSKAIIGLNYYPASAPWAEFWETFPVTEIETDLEKAKELNVNSLRIFLNHAYFDAAETREEALSKLKALLDMCEIQGLTVLITLFDLRPDYTLLNWEADIAHVDTVLSHIATHKAVFGIDLKNQADLDFESWGQGRVEAWLTVMARHIQTHYPQVPVTTGWSNPERATRLKDVFDFVTYHEYENPKGFEKRLTGVIKAVGDKPVLITELGSTIWHPPFIDSLLEKKQALRLEHQLTQASQSNGVFVWTLNDFEHVSREVVGPLPWRRAQQKYFGLIRKDGTPRPSANILKSFGARAQDQSNTIQNSPL